jgi:hypothetical protein
LPAVTEELDALRAYIDGFAQNSSAHIHLMGWKVEPKEPRDPEAKNQGDRPADDESWTVTAELEVS